MIYLEVLRLKQKFALVKHRFQNLDLKNKFVKVLTVTDY